MASNENKYFLKSRSASCFVATVAFTVGAAGAVEKIVSVDIHTAAAITPPMTATDAILKNPETSPREKARTSS